MAARLNKSFFVNLVVGFLLCVPVCAAKDWIVVPQGSAYSNTGNEYDYWNGFRAIDWSKLGAGDTLYLVGSFNEGHLRVRTGGDAGNHFQIRGDHPNGPGIINNGNLSWVDPANHYITVAGLTIINGRIQYAWPIKKYSATKIELVGPGSIRDYNKELVGRGFVPGMQIRLLGGEKRNRKSFMIRSVLDRGNYDEIILDTSADATNFLTDEGPGSKTIEPFWPIHHITVQNCKISDDDGSLVSMSGTDITIQDNELDSQNSNEHGVLYIGGNGFWTRIRNITLAGNYIHGVDSPKRDRDAHCLGVQGGIDNIVITRNHFKDCGAGIVFWNKAGGNGIGNWEITHNLIEGMDFNRQPHQWGGSGIVFTGDGEAQPGTIAYNTIINPRNCPRDPANNVACRGIRYNRNVLATIHNNTIDGHDIGIEFRNIYKADVKNNVISNSALGHIMANNAVLLLDDDNVYGPDTPRNGGGGCSVTSNASANPTMLLLLPFLLVARSVKQKVAKLTRQRLH